MIANWKKSSYSGTTNQSDCVEVGTTAGTVGVRDTKARERGHLEVSRTAWARFVRSVRA